jgi:two-component system sensor histidine kinase YesM
MTANQRRSLEYIRGSNESTAAALNALGENIHSMATYISTLESFRNYYQAREGDPYPVNIGNTTLHSSMFISTHYSIIQNIVQVNLNGHPFSYHYLNFNFEFIDLVQPYYNFKDPDALESRFFFFENLDYFIYVTPIVNLYSTVGQNKKNASCVFICDLRQVREILNSNISSGDFNIQIYDNQDQLVASKGVPPANGKKKILIVSFAKNIGLRVIAAGTSPGIINGHDENTLFILRFIVISVILLIIIHLTTIVILRLCIAQPISNLVKNIVSPDDKPLHKRLDRNNIYEINHIVDGVNILLDEISTYTQRIMADQKELYELELREHEAEIYALQSQINPHFLNNTLQCIRGIAVSHKVHEIAEIAVAMSELFRYAMNYERDALISDEIEMVKHYILITGIRFRHRFTFSFDIAPEIYGYKICRMMLQPLVENAVQHGVSRQLRGGTVEITGKIENEIISFEVADNGPGFEKKRLTEVLRELSFSFAENREMKKYGSFGLYNINRRLKLNYGEGYGLEIEHKENKTIVRIRFPGGR